MKILLLTFFFVTSMNAWSHCGGCGVGETKTSHEHSKEELAKEKAACAEKLKTGIELNDKEALACKEEMKANKKGKEAE